MIYFDNVVEAFNKIEGYVSLKIKKDEEICAHRYTSASPKFLLTAISNMLLREQEAFSEYMKMHAEDRLRVCSKLLDKDYLTDELLVDDFTEFVESFLNYDHELIYGTDKGFIDDEYLDDKLIDTLKDYIECYKGRFEKIRGRLISLSDLSDHRKLTMVKWIELAEKMAEAFDDIKKEERLILCKKYIDEEWNMVSLNEISIDLIKTILGHTQIAKVDKKLDTLDYHQGKIALDFIKTVVKDSIDAMIEQTKPIFCVMDLICDEDLDKLETISVS